MLSLFTTQPDAAGFRLHSYELYNWGTFDNLVWRLAPGGETTLLTGANASGKTTLVDGLLTLLVPEKRMRYYNQTAGSKGERTEESYVLGEFGDTENEETNSRETRRLRADKAKAQSILLAVFKNEDRFVTLVQCRWFSGSELKRNFILAHKNLSIEQDFGHFDSAGEWRKRLRQKYPVSGGKEMIHIGDSPVEYGRWMQKAFGLRSEKAHTLFSQTIGLKVLGNLDEFVRRQMLEETDAESAFQQIKDHFKTLNDAHNAIEKANEQIKYLSPIRDKAILLTQAKHELQVIQDAKELAPLWFAQAREQLLSDHIEREKARALQLEGQITELSNSLEILSDQERDLDMQIRQDKAGSRIADLEAENRQFAIQKTECESLLKHYNQLAQALDLGENPSQENVFTAQQAAAEERKTAAAEIFQQIGESIFTLKSEKNAAETIVNGIANELTLLRQQQNNITGRVAEIRAQLLQHLGASEQELPFVGELIQVRPEAQHWEYALEKLLHNFALRILVPENFYQEVNRYVNEHDLKGRIVYQRVRNETYLNEWNQSAADAVEHKLFFKSSPFSDWIKNEIGRSYDHICTDDPEDFRNAWRAITSQGLIKNNDRHEKDDRPGHKSRQNYVLGWDNREKIALLAEDARRQETVFQEKSRLLKSAEREQERVKKDELLLTQLLEIRSFKKIDWWSLSKRIQQNIDQIETLKKSNNKVLELKAQRDTVLAQIKRLQEDRDDKSRTSWSVQEDIKRQTTELYLCRQVMAKYEGLDLRAQLDDFGARYVVEHLLDLTDAEQKERSVGQKLQGLLNKVEGRLNKLKIEAADAVRRFKYPSDESLLKRFPDWKADTLRFSENVDFLDDYIAFLDLIEQEELAAYKDRFKHYLNEEMITQMSDFKSWLDGQKEEIQDNIEHLNGSLEKINFRNNPATFIFLKHEEDYAPRIKELRFRLNDWKPDLAEYARTKDDSILENSYHKIKALLDDLTEDENGRKEMLDVRNWLKFTAIELYRETRKVYRTYTGTAKLSGGEGAQLTYTILGSAIAYQFGIHREGLNPDSFRFICVDEAFSKQDDEKARFLMDLCKQLHLQLMVVSPAKAEEVAIVEPYIARVHFVYRENGRHSEILDMPMFEFRENRAKYLEINGN